MHKEFRLAAQTSVKVKRLVGVFENVYSIAFLWDFNDCTPHKAGFDKNTAVFLWFWLRLTGEPLLRKASQDSPIVSGGYQLHRSSFVLL
jgi:hypothetical protein